MDTKTANKLRGLNTDFYQRHYSSFSETRTRPWQGWNTCLDYIKEVLSPDGRAFSVLDLACGNLRFEIFLEASLPETEIAFYAVDNCEELVSVARVFQKVQYQNLDIIEALQQDTALNKRLDSPVCDLSVAFGFLHHIPLKQQREKVLLSLIEKTRSGGLVIITCWQFMKDSNFAEKALAVHRQAVEELQLTGLDENDMLLGWKNTPGVYRYCHSFSEEEADELQSVVGRKAKVRARFVADGKNDSSNTYIIFEVV